MIRRVTKLAGAHNKHSCKVISKMIKSPSAPAHLLFISQRMVNNVGGCLDWLVSSHLRVTAIDTHRVLLQPENNLSLEIFIVQSKLATSRELMAAFPTNSDVRSILLSTSLDNSSTLYLHAPITSQTNEQLIFPPILFTLTSI